MKKLVLIFGFALATVGAVFTAISIATTTSESYPFSFDFGMLIITPALIFGKVLGLDIRSTSTSPWVIGTLVTLLNTALCFLAGALAGFIIYHLSTGFSKKHETAG